MIRANPKIFLGLSDITALLNAIHHKTDLVSFHGSDLLWSFGNGLPDYEREEFTRQLVRGEVGKIPRTSRARRSGVERQGGSSWVDCRKRGDKRIMNV